MYLDHCRLAGAAQSAHSHASHVTYPPGHVTHPPCHVTSRLDHVIPCPLYIVVALWEDQRALVSERHFATSWFASENQTRTLGHCARALCVRGEGVRV